MTPCFTSLGVTPGFLALLVGGGLGAFGRAFFSGTQKTWTRKTAEDAAIGACTAVFLPYIVGALVKPIPGLAIDWATFSPAAQFMMAAGLGLLGSWAYTSEVWRRRIKRAADLAGVEVPKPGTPAMQELGVVAVKTEAVAARKEAIEAAVAKAPAP